MTGHSDATCFAMCNIMCTLTKKEMCILMDVYSKNMEGKTTHFCMWCIIERNFYKGVDKDNKIVYTILVPDGGRRIISRSRAAW